MTSPPTLPDDWEQLVAAARSVRLRAYAPYSTYHVGASVRVADGGLYFGCNVENASYGLTICAERVAMTAAVAAGHRDAEVMCISLHGVPVPCGACRQFLYEFNPQLILLLDDAETDDAPDVVCLKTLLPRGFRLES